MYVVVKVGEICSMNISLMQYNKKNEKIAEHGTVRFGVAALAFVYLF